MQELNQQPIASFRLFFHAVMDLGLNKAKCTQLVETVKASENQRLLTPLQPSYLTVRERLSHINLRPSQLCLPSKAAVLILFWTAVVSVTYKAAEETAIHVFRKNDYKLVDRNLAVLFVYLITIFVLLLYPFAGFVADVCCGRYKTVIISLCLLLCGYVCFSIVSIALYTGVFSTPYYTSRNFLFYIPLSVGLLFFVAGLSCYQANYIQLGLDQLMELPNEYLGLYVHWVKWAIEIGLFIIRPLFLLYNNCTAKDKLFYPIYHTILAMSFFFFFCLLFILLFGCWKRRWFYIEPGRNNPYKTVFRVLNFARKHKHPLRRSAFTYCDDERPCRIDFAKERYGGPFKTEQVEDVKAFLRILGILIVLGPIFLLEIPVGPLFASFSDHIGTNKTSSQQCSWSSVFHNMTILGNLAVVILFPIYIWFIYVVLRRCIPRTFVRIWAGELLFLLGMIAMFITDLSGHAEYYNTHRQVAACVFNENTTSINFSFYLNLPWTVNILPSFLTQAGITLLITTTFEFISAQSPNSMKGLLIGVFYALQGIFELVGAVSTLPFSLKGIWNSDYMNKHQPSVTNCGFGYLLFNCVVGLSSLVLFTIAAKRYKYRERDDPPFNQMNVERVWANSIQ